MGCNGMPFFSSNFLLQTEEDEHPHPHPHHQHPTSLNPHLSSYSPQNFHGIASLLAGKRAMSFSGIDHICDDVMNGEEDFSDDGLSHGGEKKRRLNIEQVKTLEKTFEQGNKLEPERKIQLARALGLQPRQIAIWFQNRRARWKTKQLEKDYGILKRHFDAVKAENDSLIAHNQKLHAEIVSLRSSRDHPELINLNKETTMIDQGSCSSRSDNSSSDMIQLDISRTPTIDSNTHVPISISLFPTSSTTHHSTSTAAQLFFATPGQHQQVMSQDSTLRPEHHHSTNTNNNQNQDIKEESLSNMFCGMEDRTGSLWPWLEQQHFN